MECDLSVIVPLYNEEDSVEPMLAAIKAALIELDQTCEIIFVDDGSQDQTFNIAVSLAASEPLLRVLKLRRNTGQTAAMAAGIDYAEGRILITMDGDLQNDPRDIPLFLDKIENGFDLVVGWRHQRQDHQSRVLPSKVANWLIGKITGVPIKDNGCSLKAYRAEIIKAIPLYSEMHRFIPAMASLAGANVAEIKVRHHPRRFGHSKYGFSRIYKVLIDLLAIRTILSFNHHPMAWLTGAALIALACSFGTFSLALIQLYTSYQTPSVIFPGLTILLGSLAIFLLFLGFLNNLIHVTMRHHFDPFLKISAREISVNLNSNLNS
ncbi:MAG: glycosyltransferase family 2 protein [Cyanobacteria bacterium J06638_22]